MGLPIESESLVNVFLKEQKMIKICIIIVLLGLSSNALVKDDRGKRNSPKYSISELLSTTFPYSDPRTDNQLDMDPCKSGEKNYHFYE